MYRHPLLNKRIDDGQTDRTTKIAHQVKQPARVWHLSRRKRAEGEGGGGKQAEHKCHPARCLLPSHPPEIVSRLQEPVAYQSNREQTIAADGQKSWITAPFGKYR